VLEEVQNEQIIDQLRCGIIVHSGFLQLSKPLFDHLLLWCHTADTEALMPTFASQLSNDQLTHLAQKSVSRAARKYSAGFMLAALDEIDRLSDLERRRLVEMPNFGEAVAYWYGAYLFFTGGEWQRWMERHGSTPSVIESATLRSSLGVIIGKLRKLMIGSELSPHG
jgi:hypothetical protein